MSAYSDAQIAQLIAYNAALKDEVAELKAMLRKAREFVYADYEDEDPDEIEALGKEIDALLDQHA